MIIQTFGLLATQLSGFFPPAAALPTNQKPLNDVEAFYQSVLQVRAEYVDNISESNSVDLTFNRLKKAEIIPTGTAGRIINPTCN